MKCADARYEHHKQHDTRAADWCSASWGRWPGRGLSADHTATGIVMGRGVAARRGRSDCPALSITMNGRAAAAGGRCAGRAASSIPVCG